MTGHALPRLTEEQFRLSTAERAAGTGSSNRKGRLPRRVLLVLVAGPIGQWRATSASSRNFGESSRNCEPLKCATSHNFGRKFVASSPAVEKVRRQDAASTRCGSTARPSSAVGLNGLSGRRVELLYPRHPRFSSYSESIFYPQSSVSKLTGSRSSSPTVAVTYHPSGGRTTPASPSQSRQP